ncbi:MAG TPA: SAM-dependent methyltransferase [Rhizomicrobium sp.]|nr:SAM-dependent methyltransferase [Rhizomicrobium sp.]
MSLKARIAALIDAQGPMSVAQFMTISLLDPKHGYYATRDPLGAGGDFITAPEVSQMFGEMLGLWLVQAWSDQGCPKNPRLVELGPGRGTLMADILRTAAVAPDFLADLEVILVEASPALQQVQADKLRGSGADISWQAQFDDSLGDRPLFLVANEFFDALPVRQYVKTERGWCERMVTVLDDELTFALAPVPAPRAAIPADRENAPDGGVYETSPAATALAEDIAGIVAAKGGAVLILDYGYAAAGGFSETLQAVSGHRFADALAEPGEDDISAHVDFAALAQAGKRGGAAVFGPATQGMFLANIGIVERAEQLMKTNPAAAPDLLSAIERLIGNEQMGTLFKVLAFVPPAVSDVAGFAP